MKLSQSELEGKVYACSQNYAELDVRMCGIENRFNEYLRDSENSDVLYKIDEVVEKINFANKHIG